MQSPICKFKMFRNPTIITNGFRCETIKGQGLASNLQIFCNQNEASCVLFLGQLVAGPNEAHPSKDQSPRVIPKCRFSPMVLILDQMHQLGPTTRFWNVTLTTLNLFFHNLWFESCNSLSYFDRNHNLIVLSTVGNELVWILDLEIVISISLDTSYMSTDMKHCSSSGIVRISFESSTNTSNHINKLNNSF